MKVVLTEQEQIDFVKNDGMLIRKIDNPTELAKIAAVLDNPFAIRHIHNPSDTVQVIAVIGNDEAVEFIDNDLCNGAKAIAFSGAFELK